MEGKIRKIFPGANTANGSFNFFDNIIQGDINRIFCFKGGPGVGKSSLMKRLLKNLLIGDMMLNYTIVHLIQVR